MFFQGSNNSGHRSQFCDLRLWSMVAILSLWGCGDSPKKRIKNPVLLQQVKRVALVSFAIDRKYTVGSGEDEQTEDNIEAALAFGGVHFAAVSKSIKEAAAGLILDIDQTLASKAYKKQPQSPSYLRKGRAIIGSDHEFISPFNDVRAIALDAESSRRICRDLGVDAALAIEVTYKLDSGMNLPILGTFIKPSWYAEVHTVSELYHSTGELIWRSDLKVKSPLKVKAAKALNVYVYSSSSVTGDQTFDLVKSAATEASKRVIEALRSDIAGNR